MTEHWTYQRGMPDRSGVAEYTHLIRHPFDGKETMARGAGKRDPHHWRRKDTVAEWRERIEALMEDGEPRTFNRICIELTGTTADVWHGKQLDAALWALVEAEQLAWACEEGAVFFCASSAIIWRESC